MKIWYVSAYDQPGGQSPRTHEFSKVLAAKGHSVTIFTNGYCHFTHTERLSSEEPWRVDFVDGVRVVWLRSRPYLGNGLGRFLNMIDNVVQVLRVSRYLGDFPDIVLGPSVPILTGWAASRLADRYAVPFVYEVRDVWPAALVDNGGLKSYSLLYFFFRYVEKLMYRHATRISSALPNLAKHVVASGGDNKKIVYIPNGINFDVCPVPRHYNGGEGRELLVFYVGGFGLGHDVITIVRCARILQEEGDRRFRFVLFGSGVRKAACVSEAMKYGLRNLEFRNTLPKAKLPYVQAEADILVAAITNSEVYRFGINLNKLCSYFASARPVLFSGNSPNDPVSMAGAGVTVKPEDPIAMVEGLRALASMEPFERARMGELGYRYARTNLCMSVLGDRMEKMLVSSIAEFAGRAQ